MPFPTSTIATTTITTAFSTAYISDHSCFVLRHAWRNSPKQFPCIFAFFFLFFAFVITSRVFPSFPPRGSRNLESRIFLQHFRPVLEIVCANRQGSWVVQWVCCTLTHLFSALVTSTSANFESLRRALGTALEWPDAKQRAHQVREWGIEVGPAQLYNFVLQNYICRLTGDLAIACYLAQS